MNKYYVNIVKWIARISGTLMLVLFFPFYVGYGLPIPSMSMTFFENLWLVIMPLFLTGLLIGWKWEKTAGFLITIPIITGFLF